MECKRTEEAESSPLKLSLEDNLIKQKWYLGGDVSEDAAVSILEASEATNCFGVHRTSDKSYMFSAKYELKDNDQATDSEVVFDHLVIKESTAGRFKIRGQDISYEDITEAVEQFIVTFEPPLVPAKESRHKKIREEPPMYSKENRSHKPEITSLCDDTEAKGGDHYTRTCGRHGDSEAMFQPLSQWHYYKDLHRCHPENVCHGCCFREKKWDAHGYYHAYKWYDVRGSGPLRVLGLLLFWLLCGLCFGCVKVCLKCLEFFCSVILFYCCGVYDSS